jgi:RHS repeat-associated protein
MGVTTTYYFAGSTRVAVRQGSVVSYLHADHPGSASLTTDANGNPTSQLRYLPYGAPRSGYPTGSVPTDYRFTGQRSEEATLGSLYDYGARFYSPYLNRWIQPDTIVPQPGNPQDLNRFSYARNNPLKYIDRDGHIPIIPLIILGVMAVGMTMMIQQDRARTPEQMSPEDNFSGAVGEALFVGAGGAGSAYVLLGPAGVATACVGSDCAEKAARAYENACGGGRCEDAAEAVTDALKPAIAGADKLGNARDVALGINENLQIVDFARQTQSHWYGEWGDAGLTDRPVSSFNFGPAFQQAMDRAGKINFALDGIRGNPVDFARLGSTGDFGQVPFTARELYLISQNPQWLAKTIFYQNGQVVSSPFTPQ